MTTELLAPSTTTFTISGVGPYAIDHAYDDVGDFRVFVEADDVLEVELTTDDFTVVEAGPATDGNLYLSSTAATLYDGETLHVERTTSLEQLWAGVNVRERGLEAQLDRMAQAIQETQRDTARGVKVLGADLVPFKPVDGKSMVWDEASGSFVAGLSQDAIDAAEAAAAASATAAATSATGAGTSATAAATSATAASTSATGAGTSATAAATSATAAATSATGAGTSATAAATSATAAATSATGAAASAAAAAASEGDAATSAAAAAVSAGLIAAAGVWRADVAEILADTDLTYTAAQPGTVVAGDKIAARAEGASYAVAASGASDHHLTTAGGVKLYALPSAEGTFSVTAFGAVGDGATDDTAAIEAAIAAAEDAGKALVFPRADYVFSSPLSITGIDVAFQKSVLRYEGGPGSFALTLNSNPGASSNQRNGNRFSDLNLIQEDWSEYVTYSGSTTFDPPSIAASATITAITPVLTTTTVTVVGARAGGYVRVTFDQLADGCTVCGAVTADDEVTVYFSNYTASAVDMASGTLSVDVVNNAYHGLCLGSGLGVLENSKILGFTGVSLGMGSGICQITGVTFPATQEAYYWYVGANLAPAAGWGLVVQPRNNENNFAVTLFPIDAYGDSIPRRACTINQVVMSGVTNNFHALSLESVSSEESLLLTDASNLITASKPIYFEANTNFAAPPEPYVRAMPYSSACDMTFRMYGGLGKIADEGVANDLRVPPAFYINGQGQSAPVGGESLVANGDFANGTYRWDNWSSNSTLTIPGAGYFTGKRVRIDVTAGRPNLQQEVDKYGPAEIAQLAGRTLTFGAWVKTDLNNIVLRVNGNPSPVVPPDGDWHFVPVTMRNTSDTAIDLSIIEATGATQTGYVEVSNVTGLIGTRTAAFGPPTAPTGSKTYDPPSLATGARTSTTVTVSGAALGDYVTGVSFSRDVQGIELWGYVSAADTVTVVLANNSGATVDLASGTLRAVCRKA